MKTGTKSVLFGAHCFFLHPWFVAWAWIKLYGFPLDLRIWIAFFVHDLGYLGKPNMDGPEGEAHVELGAKIMHWFDWWKREEQREIYPSRDTIYEMQKAGWKPKSTAGPSILWVRWVRQSKWQNFSMYHSRYYAKNNNAQPSALCFADKLSFALTPAWLYLPMVTATGEINEYLKNGNKANDSGRWTPTGEDKELWHHQLCKYMIDWVAQHKDGSVDTWTNSERHSDPGSAVWK